MLFRRIRWLDVEIKDVVTRYKGVKLSKHDASIKRLHIWWTLTRTAKRPNVRSLEVKLIILEDGHTSLQSSLRFWNALMHSSAARLALTRNRSNRQPLILTTSRGT